MVLNRSEKLQKSMTNQPAIDGQIAQLFVLKNRQGMCITLMDIGATWLSCEINIGTESRDVILGVCTMAEHLQQKAYFGATIGRFANRIAHGKFSIEGTEYSVPQNEVTNALHGGPCGFDKRRWKAEQESESKISFTLHSQDGDQGFPGNLHVTVFYELNEENKLTISYQAITDQPCPVNLTNHTYFNLMGDDTEFNCLDHKIMIQADKYLPTDEIGIPIGNFKPVANSGFDFRKMKLIGLDFLKDLDQQLLYGYDHSFLIKKPYQDGKKVIAKCISPDNKITLEVCTTKPAVQFYSGNYLAGTPNRSTGEYQKQAGFALETQFLPDSPNHPEWDQPSSILSVDEIYRHETSYKFIVNSEC